MSFSYLSTAPASSSRSWVRLRLNDHSSSNYQLEDEEIDALLSVHGTKYATAAAAAEQIAGIYAGKSDKTVGKLSISHGAASDRYYKLADRLRSESNLFATPYAGGISVDDKQTDESDSDVVQPAFFVGQFEDAGVSGASSTEC